MAELCPLFSGTRETVIISVQNLPGILVDIGRSCKQVTTVMQRCGIDPLSVQGILITHEHSDHISGLRVFASKYHIPVFASKGTLGALESMGILSDKYPAYTIEDTLELAGMHVNAFRTPHDCAGASATVHRSRRRTHRHGRDGHWTSRRRLKRICTAQILRSLNRTTISVCCARGRTVQLKRRILSDFGHLSNTACGPTCCRILKTAQSTFCWRI